MVPDDKKIFYFMRSAWTFSPSHVPVFWLGDQLQSYDGYDGIHSALTGALASALSGHALSHSDIGGYNAEINVSVTDPVTGQTQVLNYIRSDELLMRWSEFGAFGFPLFRTHIGSSMSELVSQVYDNEKNIKHFARFSNIYKALAEYRIALMKEAESFGYPMVRSVVVLPIISSLPFSLRTNQHFSIVDL